jgi:nucleotide-binding universal stress UspA family protein
MKIIFAADQHPYSEFALNEVIRLVINTWADVSVVGTISLAKKKGPSWAMPLESGHALHTALHRYRESFFHGWDQEDHPYAMRNWGYEWFSLGRGRWEEVLVCRGGKREFKVRLRVGDAAQELLAESTAEGSDLIVLGCTAGARCVWEGSGEVPQRVVNEADCSVFLVKERKPINRIVACLDQSYISQDSLEMINQVASLYGAGLELIGLSQEGAMKKDVYRRLIEIGDYYEDRQIQVTTSLTDIAEFEAFIAHELKHDLLALWMGKKSLLDRFFPREWVGRFVSKCGTSVLVLR